MTRDRFEVIMKALADGKEIENPRCRFEKIMSAIAVAIGSGGGEPVPTNEVIDITAGTGTNNRTFTFDKVPKFISIAYYNANGKAFSTSFVPIAGDNVTYFYAWLDKTDTGSVSTGALICGHALSSADGKTITFYGAAPDGALNGSSAAGKIYVEY